MTRYLKILLYGVRPDDPVTYLAVVIGICAAVGTSIYLPARRAAAMDAVAALRRE